MVDIRSGMERKCTAPGCKGRMRAGTEMQIEYDGPSHVWQCTTNPEEHTETCKDADIAEADILPPR